MHQLPRMEIRCDGGKGDSVCRGSGVLEEVGTSHLAAGLRLSGDEGLQEFDLCSSTSRAFAARPVN